jgi:hypothetical protein
MTNENDGAISISGVCMIIHKTTRIRILFGEVYRHQAQMVKKKKSAQCCIIILIFDVAEDSGKCPPPTRFKSYFLSLLGFGYASAAGGVIDT